MTRCHAGIYIGLDEASSPQQRTPHRPTLSHTLSVLSVQPDQLQCQHAAQDHAYATGKHQSREKADLTVTPPLSTGRLIPTDPACYPTPGPPTTIQRPTQCQAHAIAAVPAAILHFLEVVIVCSERVGLLQRDWGMRLGFVWECVEHVGSHRGHDLLTLDLA